MLRITDEGSLLEMRIWSILLIKSDLKGCIHLSRSLLYVFVLLHPACCTSVLDYQSTNLQITSKLLTQGYKYHKLQKHLEMSIDHTPNFCRNLVIFRYQNSVNGFIFVGTNFHGLNKNHTLVGFKIRCHRVLLHNSYIKSLFRGYWNSWIGPTTKPQKLVPHEK